MIKDNFINNPESPLLFPFNNLKKLYETARNSPLLAHQLATKIIEEPEILDHITIDDSSWPLTTLLCAFSEEDQNKLIKLALETPFRTKKFLPTLNAVDFFLSFGGRKYIALVMEKLTDFETFKRMLCDSWFLPKIYPLSKKEQTLILKPLLSDLKVFKEVVSTPTLFSQLLRAFHELTQPLLEIVLADKELYAQCIANAHQEIYGLTLYFEDNEALFGPLLDYDIKIFKGLIDADFLLSAAFHWRFDANKLERLSQFLTEDADEFKRLFTAENQLEFREYFPSIEAFKASTPSEAFKILQSQKEKLIIKNTIQLLLQGKRSSNSPFKGLFNQNLAQIASYLTINKWEDPEKECHLTLNKLPH